MGIGRGKERRESRETWARAPLPDLSAASRRRRDPIALAASSLARLLCLYSPFHQGAPLPHPYTPVPFVPLDPPRISPAYSPHFATPSLFASSPQPSAPVFPQFATRRPLPYGVCRAHPHAHPIFHAPPPFRWLPDFSSLFIPVSPLFLFLRRESRSSSLRGLPRIPPREPVALRTRSREV